jgi:hypothetical protein
MRKRYPDRNFVLETEQEARCATRADFADSDWRFGTVIDEMLKLAHFEGPLEPVSTEFGAFQSYARFQYIQSTYTLFSTYRLWQIAYYPEALALLRHLLEVFVQIRYFLRHPDRLARHLSERRTTFRKMFEEFSPGSYDALYGRFLSNIAHGRSALPFRGEQVNMPDEPGRIAFRAIQGAKYERRFAAATHFCLTGVTLGLLDVHASVFRRNTVENDTELADDLRDTRNWLRALLDEGRARADQTDLFDFMDRLITVE